MEPIFALDVRDRATGKQAAVRLSRDEALLPLGEVACRTLRASPEQLVDSGRLAPEQADTFFRLQDLLFPVDGRGRLGSIPYDGLLWRRRDDGAVLDPARPALFERVRRAGAADVLVLPLDVDRRDLCYERNWRGFHARRYTRFRPAAECLIAEALPDGFDLDGPDGERRFVEALARRIALADFENYSRFVTPAIRLKTGDETVENILAGHGGVCTEKVLALKFITDAHGLASRVVFAGPHTAAPLPAAELRAILDRLDTYDFTYARRFLRYWDHVALEYRLSDGSRWLVDPSGGTIPFVCAPAAPYLDAKAGRRRVLVAMLAVAEPVTYHRAPVSLGLDFLFAWETWIDDVDLLQVFDNNLGLLVSEDFYVTVVVSGSRTKRAVALDGWRAYACEHGLRADFTGESGTADEQSTVEAFRASHPVQAAGCEAALPGLARRYREFILSRHGVDKPFEATLVVIDRRRVRNAERGVRSGGQVERAHDLSPASAAVEAG